LNKSSASPTCAIKALVASTFAFSARARQLLDHQARDDADDDDDDHHLDQSEPPAGALLRIFHDLLLDVRHFQNRSRWRAR
jgi:hypothetical protein